MTRRLTIKAFKALVRRGRKRHAFECIDCPRDVQAGRVRCPRCLAKRRTFMQRARQVQPDRWRAA